MNEVKSQQAINTSPPADHETTVALYLECPQCGTSRGFGLNAVLARITQRRTKSIALTSTCSQCGKEFKATLGWVDRTREGWTANPDFREPCGGVNDNMQMELPQ